MFARRAQFHQSRITEHLTWFDRNFQNAVEWGKEMLAGRGIPGSAAEETTLKMIYGQVVRQATAMGFNDAFWILSVMMACVLPLLLLMKRPDHQSGPPRPGH